MCCPPTKLFFILCAIYLIGFDSSVWPMEPWKEKNDADALPTQAPLNRTTGQRRTYSEGSDSTESSSSKRTAYTHFLEDAEYLEPIDPLHLDAFLPLSLEELEQPEANDEWQTYLENIPNVETSLPTSHSLSLLTEPPAEEEKVPTTTNFAPPLNQEAEPMMQTFFPKTFRKEASTEHDVAFITPDFLALLRSAREALLRAQDSSLRASLAIPTMIQAAEAAHQVLSMVFLKAPDSPLADHANRYELLLTLAEQSVRADDSSMTRLTQEFQTQKSIKEASDAYELMEHVTHHSSDGSVYPHRFSNASYQQQKETYDAACIRVAMVPSQSTMPEAEARKLARNNLLETISASLDFFDIAAKNHH